MAGIFAHIKGMTAICNPLVNSYKRLAPGFEAPSDITWSSRQRTALIRVPQNVEGGTRLELRSPDASSNPYLVLALCLEAGLDGIEKQMELSPELKQSIRKLNKKEKEEKTVLIPFHADRQLDYNKQTFFRGGYLFLQSIYYQMQMNKICRKLKQNINLIRHQCDPF